MTNEERRTYMKKWREAHRESYNKYQQEWRKNNKEKVAQIYAKHWAKKARELEEAQ